MKNAIFLSILFILLGCDNKDDDQEVVVCPDSVSSAHVLTVDYTTNTFLGGYKVMLTTDCVQELDLACEYKAPGDFGSVMWYDKVSQEKLFAGTITWSGKGERTFPEEISSADSFAKMKVTVTMPLITPLYHDDNNPLGEEFDYTPIWQSISNLHCVSWVTNLTPAYIYLYCPSVGGGDPANWYWIIFLKHYY